MINRRITVRFLLEITRLVREENIDSKCPRRRPRMESFSIDRAVMTQFCPADKSVSLSRIVSSSSIGTVPARITRPFSKNYLHSAFAAQSKGSCSDVWIGDSDASCHMTNNAPKMYCVRPPLLDQRDVTTSDGTRLRVECVGNIDVVFQGRSDEPITLCDVSYVPDLRFDLFFIS